MLECGRAGLADYCLWVPDGEQRPCYAQADLVLVQSSGQTLGFSCRAHREAWAGRIRGTYQVLERDEWEARGAGHCGKLLGG